MTPTMGEDFGAGETAPDRGGETSLTSGEREALLRAHQPELLFFQLDAKQLNPVLQQGQAVVAEPA